MYDVPLRFSSEVPIHILGWVVLPSIGYPGILKNSMVLKSHVRNISMTRHIRVLHSFEKMIGKQVVPGSITCHHYISLILGYRSQIKSLMIRRHIETRLSLVVVDLWTPSMSFFCHREKNNT